MTFRSWTRLTSRQGSIRRFTPASALQNRTSFHATRTCGARRSFSTAARVSLCSSGQARSGPESWDSLDTVTSVRNLENAAISDACFGRSPSDQTASIRSLRKVRNAPRSRPRSDSRVAPRSSRMYHHVKKLLHAVRVDAPDPKFGNMLLEQIGGANGELVTAMQYFLQAVNCDDLALKDLLMDIATEELSHLEIVAALARLHLQPMKFDRDCADVNPLLAVADGAG